jgi:tetratricopeptide (TPR) repeat protein
MNLFSTQRVLLIAGRTSVFFIALIVPLSFSIGLEDGFELPQTLFTLVAIFFSILVLGKFDWKSAFRQNSFLYFSFFGFLAVGIFSFLGLAHEVSFYFPAQNYLWLLSAVLFLAPVGLFIDKRKFYAFLVLAGILGSFYSFAQAFGFDLAGWDTHFGGRSFSTLGNPIFWAGHLLVLLPLALYLAFSSEGRIEKFFWFGALFILTVSLLTTRTRGAWAGALGELLILALLSWKAKWAWKGFLIGIIAFLLTIFFIPSLQERAVSIFHIHSEGASGRYFMWDAARKLWEEKIWMGQGPGGYASHFHRIQAELSQAQPFHPYWTAFHAHNEYWELLAERGILGFLFGAMVLAGLAFRRLRTVHPAIFSLETSELAVLAGLAIHSAVNFPLSIVPTAAVLALLFNPSWKQERGSFPAAKSDSSRLWPAIGTAFLLIYGMAARVTVQNARLHRAIDLMNGQQYQEALELLNSDRLLSLLHYSDPRVLSQRAAALNALGQTPEAIGTLNDLVRAYPYDADAYATLCMLYGKQEKWEEAIASGQKALALSPCHEQALNNLAFAAYLEGKPRQAIQYLSRLEQAEDFWGQTAKASEIQRKISALARSR